MNKSILGLKKINAIQNFREEYNGKIKSEEVEGENCVKFILKNKPVKLIRDYYDYEISGVLLSGLPHDKGH